MKSIYQTKLLAVAVATALGLSGCGIAEVRSVQKDAMRDTRAQLDAAPRSRPVFQIHEGAWLLGEKVKATKPQPELFNKPVSYNDARDRISTLADVADWIARTYNVRVVIDPSVNAPFPAAQSIAVPGAAGAVKGPQLPAGLATSLAGAPAAVSAATVGVQPVAAAMPMQSPLHYVGDFKGFMRTNEQRYNVYSRYRDGTLTFFRVETRNFTLPDMGAFASMSGTISSDGNLSSSSGGTSTSTTSSTSGGSSGSGTGGQTASQSLEVKPWKRLEEIAKQIAGNGAEVIADPNLGTVTVTGTPPQCDRVEDWVRTLDAMFGKQVAIDVRIYEVRLNQEDNYGLNLSLGYKSGNGHTGATFTGVAPPTVSSNATPLSVGATIVGGKLDGTKVAVQALSTLGNVTQVVSRSGVTQNGKVMAMQSATLQDYIPSSQTTLASNVGSTSSMQTAPDISGFTSTFTPKVVNGRILIMFDMTLSNLNPLQEQTQGSGASLSKVQLRTKPLARFQQTVGLKPGESLVLTGLRDQTTSTTNNGVGSPYNPLAGGGVDASKRETMIAVVITARLL
ncbi:pilus assembly protein PilN [Ralstonia solanacearum]|jgi:type IVB pilus formation R64 PilN family outer membrane protein|uniref:type II secretion system protein GspD n=1 Tax=Ralstonia sp. 3PA37C10 TaxID=2502217 RepID=UPI0010F9658E|nr:pilus assembly protein PilN [Ralstonia sp. 3PA37C10]NKA75231.1 pilus assembly protein PilN [Ralstonia solanacearum]NKG12340.1 pilus assembly protein PilN [Ralstonia solanacearum]